MSSDSLLHQKLAPRRFLATACALAVLLGAAASPANAVITPVLGWPNTIRYADATHFMGVRPTGVVFSPDGKTIYVTLLGSDVMQIDTAMGELSRIVERPEWKANHKTFMEAEEDGGRYFETPTGIAVSSDSKTVYISDSGHHRIIALDVASRKSCIFAGGIGKGDELDSSNPHKTQLCFPAAIALSPDDSWLYIADRHNHRVLRVNTASDEVELFAGGLGEGAVFNAHDPKATQLAYPDSLAVSGDSVFIGEYATNRRILRIRTE